MRYDNERDKGDHRHFGKRDVKAVHGDVTALLNAGVLERAEAGGIVFPFDAVKVEFMLEAA